MFLSSHIAFVKKLVFVALSIFGFIFTYHAISGCLDNDFGWQLAFGKTTLTAGFPYTDTATWTYFGKTWINHEWGTSILWWWLFSHVGYYAIVFVVSLAAWLAFTLIPVAFKQPLSITSLIISLLALRADSFYLAPRPTILVALLFVILVATLERVPTKKYVYTWPLLFWVWAALHGSWILGFILIALYIVGNAIQALFATRLGLPPSAWNRRTYCQVIGSATSAFIVTIINPYTWHLWHEIGDYFTQNYYQQFITEWMPSYVYPIYWFSLITVTVALVFAVHAFWLKKISLTQLLLFLALAFAGFSHKRNMTYVLLVTVPLLTAYADTVGREIKKLFSTLHLFLVEYILIATILCAVVFVGVRMVLTSRFDTNIFAQENYLTLYGFPVGAAQALHTLPHTQPRHIFNEYHWGGYLTYTAPYDLLYIDGRGTVSWSVESNTPLYKTYREIRFEKGGLAKLEATSVDTILIHKKFLGVPQPDFLNRLAFSSAYLSEMLRSQPSELENDLRASQGWQLVYEDYLSELWIRR